MLPLPFRFSSIVVLGALAVVACGNISLSSSTSAAPPMTVGFSDIDAAADAGSSGATLAPDAGAAPAITGNPLCNYGFANTTSHTCVPDSDETHSQCAQTTDEDASAKTPVLPSSDAGAQTGGDDSDGGAGTASDAGAPFDAGTADDDAAASAMLACHVVESDGGVSTTQTCTIVGKGKDGDQCQVSTDCAAAYECVGMPGQCRHYCCGGNTVCDSTYAPSFCDVQPVASGKFDVPVCMPVSGCSLFGKCPTDQTCAVVKDDGTTSCVAVGTAGVGDACDERHCAAGLTCLGSNGARTCFELCHVDSPVECPAGTTCTGSAQLFKDPVFGICQ